MAARIAIMAITTRSSMSVKPACVRSVFFMGTLSEAGFGGVDGTSIGAIYRRSIYVYQKNKKNARGLGLPGGFICNDLFWKDLKAEVRPLTGVAVFRLGAETELPDDHTRRQPFGVPVREHVVCTVAMLLRGDPPPYVGALKGIVAAIDQRVGVRICLRTVGRLFAHVPVQVVR